LTLIEREIEKVKQDRSWTIGKTKVETKKNAHSLNFSPEVGVKDAMSTGDEREKIQGTGGKDKQFGRKEARTKMTKASCRDKGNSPESMVKIIR